MDDSRPRVSVLPAPIELARGAVVMTFALLSADAFNCCLLAILHGQEPPGGLRPESRKELAQLVESCDSYLAENARES